MPMQALHLIHSQNKRNPGVNSTGSYFHPDKVQEGDRRSADKPSTLTAFGAGPDDNCTAVGTGQFFKNLSIKAKDDFESLATEFECPRETVLIREEQRSSRVLFLLHGNVKISMNSFDGRRFLLGLAGAGDILGITSAVSGNPSEIRAESMYPCTIASLKRQDFLDFLRRHPIGFEIVATELSLHCARAFERLRMFGLTASVKSRLAGLLLEWCKDAHKTKGGTQFWCVLTHEEIGECIGASRETITRSLGDLKNRGLLEFRGTILTIPNCKALACYAGLYSANSTTNPGEPSLRKHQY
jgi:CRP/FNR family transcriptional regulator, cyclic AMP receptor protein